MGAYSADLRKPVLEDSDAGLPTKQAAEKYQVSSAWVRRLKQRRRETGEITPRSSRPKSAKKLLADHLDTPGTTRAQPGECHAGEIAIPVAGRGERADVVAAPAGTEAVVQKKICLRPSKTGRMSNCGDRLGKPR